MAFSISVSVLAIFTFFKKNICLKQLPNTFASAKHTAP